MAGIRIDRDLNPFPWYHAMRRDAPVYRDPAQGIWHVFRYTDVQQTLSDHARFSSQFGGDRRDPGRPLASSIINTDPPRHRQLRALVTQAFTPRAVDALAPRIGAIVDELLDRATAAGRMEVIADFAAPLPVTVIAELLGIPAADRARFKAWSDAVVSNASPDSMSYHGDATGEMAAYFARLIEARRRDPGDDLISGLLAAEIDGQRLTLPELLGFGSLLLIAGNETTTNLLGNALLAFTEQPGTWQRLRAERDLLPGTIEEVLRFRSPVQSMYRVTTTPVEFAGQTIPAGELVVAWIGSANHDEAQFEDPERLDIQRSPNRHLAFGQGIHFCLGAPLARLEARIALNALLDRWATVQIAAGARLERLPSTIVFGLRHLPVEFG